MDIKQLTLKSIQRYYSILKMTGNVDNTQLYKLLILVFIEGLLNDNFSLYLAEEDYEVLLSTVECISKSTCLVPWDKIAIHKDLIKNFLEDTPIRISEEDIVRLAETDVLKLISK